MSGGRAVLAVSIGPVQGFIQAARRTADLFQGSALLSELALAAARSVEDQRGELVFPHPARTAPDTRARFHARVANKLVAIVDASTAESVARNAEGAVHERWLGMVAAVRSRLRRASAEWTDWIDDGRLSEQCRPEDWIEFYAAWSEYQEGLSHDPYARALDLAETLLDARKRVRDFAPRRGPDGEPKSWQDPGRETIFRRTSLEARAAVRGLRRAFHHPTLLRETEQLDGISLVKRVLPLADEADDKDEPFPSVGHVAARPGLDHWWNQAGGDGRQEKARQYLAALRSAAAQAGGLRRYRDEEQRTGNPLRGVDPEWLDEDGFEKRFRELFDDEADSGVARTAKALAAELRELDLSVRRYVAVIQADGDEMGRRIGDLAKLSGREGHRRLSDALAAFGDEIVGLLEEKGVDGRCVYAGGDDLLALTPTVGVVAALQAIDSCFRKHVESITARTPLSVSIGVAVVHESTVFEEMRKLSKGALDAAKQARGAAVSEGGKPEGYTAVLLSKRAGAHLLISDTTAWLAAKLRALTEDFRLRRLSSKTPYDLQIGLEAVPWMPLAPGIASFPNTVAGREVKRILMRKRGEEGEKLRDEQVEALLEVFSHYVGTEAEWNQGRWREAVHLLLVAREIAAQTPGKRP